MHMINNVAYEEELSVVTIAGRLQPIDVHIINPFKEDTARRVRTDPEVDKILRGVLWPKKV